jgi:hypothetical protein
MYEAADVSLHTSQSQFDVGVLFFALCSRCSRKPCERDFFLFFELSVKEKEAS